MGRLFAWELLYYIYIFIIYIYIHYIYIYIFIIYIYIHSLYIYIHNIHTLDQPKPTKKVLPENHIFGEKTGFYVEGGKPGFGLRVFMGF